MTNGASSAATTAAISAATTAVIISTITAHQLMINNVSYTLKGENKMFMKIKDGVIFNASFIKEIEYSQDRIDIKTIEGSFKKERSRDNDFDKWFSFVKEIEKKIT